MARLAHRLADPDPGRRGAADPGRDAAGRERSAFRCAAALGRVLAAPFGAPADLPGRARARSWTATRCGRVDVRGASEHVAGGADGDRDRADGRRVSPRRRARRQAVAIATGGFLPEGADAVVMVEHTSSAAGRRAARVAGSRARSRRAPTSSSAAKTWRAAPPCCRRAGACARRIWRCWPPSASPPWSFTAARASPCCRPATSCAIRPRRRARARCATPTRSPLGGAGERRRLRRHPRRASSATTRPRCGVRSRACSPTTTP